MILGLPNRSNLCYSAWLHQRPSGACNGSHLSFIAELNFSLTCSRKRVYTLTTSPAVVLPVSIFILVTAYLWFLRHKFVRGGKVNPWPSSVHSALFNDNSSISLVKLCWITSEHDHAAFPAQMSLAWWLCPVSTEHPRPWCWGRFWCPRASSPRPLCEDTGEFLWNLQQLLSWTAC